MSTLEENYTPKTLDEFIISSNILSELKEWICDSEKRESPLLILGSTGTGKTKLANLLSQFAEANLYVISAFSVKGKVALKEITDDLFRCNSIYHKAQVLLIDDIDVIINSDKGFISEISKIMKTNIFKIPVIFTSSTLESKKMNELKKNCKVIKLSELTIPQMSLVIDKVISKENITFENRLEAKQKLYKLVAGDYRRLFQIFEFLRLEKKVLSTDRIGVIVSRIDAKQHDYGIFQMSEKLFMDDLTVDEMYHMYNSEKSLLPLMVHENYLKFCVDITTEDNEVIEPAIEQVEQISEDISVGDVFEHHIYANQDWTFDYHGNSAVMLPISRLPYPPPKRTVIFTKILTKASSHASRRKEIADIITGLGERTGRYTGRNDIHQVVLLITKKCDTFIREKNFKGLAEYISEIGLTNTQLESVYKAVSIANKSTLTLPQKREIAKAVKAMEEESKTKKKKFSIFLDEQ